MIVPKPSCQKLLSVSLSPDPAYAGGDAHTTVVDFRPPQHTETPLSCPWELSFHSPSPPLHPKATFCFTFCLWLNCFASTIPMNLPVDYNISPSSTSTAHRIYFFFSLYRQNISFAPKMRSIETQKVSKSCHGLLAQLNWRCIRASLPRLWEMLCLSSRQLFSCFRHTQVLS